MTLSVIVSALVAAGAAYICNRLARRSVGTVAVVFVAPGLEESFKTGTALLLGAPVLLSHIAFGLLEAAYDLFARRRAARGPAPAPAAAGASGPWRLGAALAGLGGHALFGALTVAVSAALGSWALGVGAAYLVHVGWNALVMGRVRTQS